MRVVLACALLGAMTLGAAADTYVNGYFRSDGTYVQPHYRSNPDSSRLNNWSTQGNVNPHTGKEGTVDPYGSSSYGSYGARSNDFGYGSGRRW